MKKAILALLTLTMLACTKNTSQEQHEPIKVAEIYTITDTHKSTAIHYNQSSTLVAFKQNNSKVGTQTTEKILHKELRADTLIIKIRSAKNFNTQYKGNFYFADNHLNLNLQQLPKIIKRKNGESDTIYIAPQPDCAYEFTYTINHIHTLPQTISLNGKIIN